MPDQVSPVVRVGEEWADLGQAAPEALLLRYW